MRGSRIEALGLAAVLVGWSLVAQRLPSRWHPVPAAVVGTVLAALTRAPLGLHPPTLWVGLRLGSTVAAPVLLGVAAGTALPAVRAQLVERKPPDNALRWVALGIPLGTVWAEETMYRAALGTLAAEAFGAAGGRMVQSAAFGLSHIADARSTGEPILHTVLATGAAGWAFGWLQERAGSLAAPMLVHLALNDSGALATLGVHRARQRRGLTG